MPLPCSSVLSHQSASRLLGYWPCFGPRLDAHTLISCCLKGVRLPALQGVAFLQCSTWLSGHAVANLATFSAAATLVWSQEEWEVADIAEMCIHLDHMPPGSTVSYNQTLSFPASFTGVAKEKSRLAAMPVWPRRTTPAIKETVEGKQGLFSLQPGPGDAVVCPIHLKEKCIQDVTIDLHDTHCVLFDATCSFSVLQNVVFQGAPPNPELAALPSRTPDFMYIFPV
jgi:hypothetical protein